MTTVFTPTYNRTDTLDRLYQSLIRQTDRDFEWLIVDDGSTDGTKGTVDGFIAEGRIRVRYVCQENGGKHRAYNRALELAEGTSFFCVDSDDWLCPDAVERIENTAFDSILIAYKEDAKGKLLSDRLPEGLDVVTFRDLRFAYGCRGEFSLVFRTAYARRYPFPIFSGERFMTEAVVYDRMRDGAKLLRTALTVCEYQADGLSDDVDALMKENPAGYCLYFMQQIDLQQSALQRLIAAGKYHAFCRFAGEKRSEYTGPHGLCVGLARPLGFLFRRYYRLKRGF